MISAGIDAGTCSAKVALMRGGETIALAAVKAGRHTQSQTVQHALELACRKAEIVRGNIDCIATTGMGRHQLDNAEHRFSDAICLARGISKLWPKAGTVLDMGYQKSLAVHCSDGRPQKIKANDRCASGSGRFLEMVAEIFGIPPEDLGVLSLQAKDSLEVENTCAVFAESEIITLIHNGKPPAEIIRGVHQAVAKRVYTLLLHVDWTQDVCLVGGVARNEGLVRELEGLLDTKIMIPPHQEYTAALGAALVGEAQCGG